MLDEVEMELHELQGVECGENGVGELGEMGVTREVVIETSGELTQPCTPTVTTHVLQQIGPALKAATATTPTATTSLNGILHNYTVRTQRKQPAQPTTCELSGEVTGMKIESDYTLEETPPSPDTSDLQGFLTSSFRIQLPHNLNASKKVIN